MHKNRRLPRDFFDDEEWALYPDSRVRLFLTSERCEDVPHRFNRDR